MNGPLDLDRTLEFRQKIIETALSFKGTPYHHGMSERGLGCDCLGLLLGVWRALRLGPCPPLTPYSSDWFETTGRELLLEGLALHLIAKPLEALMASDVLVFRMMPEAKAKHLAIVVSGTGLGDRNAKIIHAYSGQSVVVSWLHPFWAPKAVAAFAWPLGDASL